MFVFFFFFGYMSSQLKSPELTAAKVIEIKRAKINKISALLIKVNSLFQNIFVNTFLFSSFMPINPYTTYRQS